MQVAHRIIGGGVKHVSNRLRSSFQVDGDGLSWPTPTALGGVGIGPRRWRAGGSRAMGRSRRSTGAAALLPVGLGLTSREEPLVKNSLEATSRQGMEVAR